MMTYFDVSNRMCKLYYSFLLVDDLIKMEEIQGFLGCPTVRKIEKMMDEVTEIKELDCGSYVDMRDYICFMVLQGNAQRPGVLLELSIKAINNALVTTEGAVLMVSRDLDRYFLKVSKY